MTNPSDSKFIDEIPITKALDIIIRNNTAFIITEVSVNQYELNPDNIKDFKKISSFTF